MTFWGRLLTLSVIFNFFKKSGLYFPLTHDPFWLALNVAYREWQFLIVYHAQQYIGRHFLAALCVISVFVEKSIL